MLRWLPFVGLVLVACGDGALISDEGDGDGVEADAGPGAPDAGADAAPLARCLPAALGPFWLVEGETVSFAPACTTGERASFTLAELPEGASFDGTTFTWTPGLDQAQVLELAFAAELDGHVEALAVKVGVADAFDTPGNLPVVDPTRYPEELGLPVLFLNDAPTTDVDYVPTTVIYRGHTYAAEGKWRGATSLTFPKKGYTLKFPKADKFAEPDRAGGFHEKRKIVLISNFDDNSYVRQRLAFDLWNLLSAEHIQIQSYSAVVYLNGAYHGLYTIADHVNGYLMEDHGLRQDGNLYKAISHEADFRSKNNLHAGYEKKDGLPETDFSDLDALVAWTGSATAETFRNGVDARLERADFEDWWIFVTCILADDSAGKNSYLYHDPLDPASRWRFIPWDFNHSFGQTWLTERQDFASTSEYRGRNQIFALLLADPAFATPMRARYQAALAGVWQLDTVLARLDAHVAEVEASARRDERKWQADYRSMWLWNFRTDYTDFSAEVSYVRQWIADRWAYVATHY
jgi:spore coat protein CotH